MPHAGARLPSAPFLTVPEGQGCPTAEGAQPWEDKAAQPLKGPRSTVGVGAASGSNSGWALCTARDKLLAVKAQDHPPGEGPAAWGFTWMVQLSSDGDLRGCR